MNQITDSHKPTMSSLDKHQKLIMQHAYYSDLIRDLKAKGCEEAALCLGVDYKTQTLGSVPFQPRVDQFTFEVIYSAGLNDRITCISNAFHATRDANAEAAHDDGYEFEEIWEELVGEGLVCQHCIEVRRLKRERIAASRGLGAIRGAMTRVGRDLAQGGAA